MKPFLEEGPRGLNKSAAPIKRITKNTMKMKSKAFAAKRRVSNAMTNTSKKAVSKKTSGMRGAGKSIGKKGPMKVKSVTQVSPQQMAQPGARALSRTVSMQPQKASVSARKGPSLPKTYASSQKAVRKAMGYSS